MKLPAPNPAASPPPSEPSPPVVRHLRAATAGISPVVLPGKWRVPVAYFLSIEDGRLGFDPVEFPTIRYHSRELLPKIYTSEGLELLPFGPVSVEPIEGCGKNRIRLVLVSIFNNKRQRIFQALAWQGCDALHLLSDVESADDLQDRMNTDLNDETINYIHHWFNTDRSTDWFLDCEMEI